MWLTSLKAPTGVGRITAWCMGITGTDTSKYTGTDIHMALKACISCVRQRRDVSGESAAMRSCQNRHLLLAELLDMHLAMLALIAASLDTGS